MKRLFSAFVITAAIFAISCGGGGGQDVLDSIEADVQGDVIQDTQVSDITDVREDAEVIIPPDVVDIIDDVREDEIQGGDIPEDAKTDVPETCECFENQDCNGVFNDLGPCEIAACDNCACVKAFLPEDDPCDDGNECTVDEKCNTDHVCGGGTNACPCSGDQDCTRYDDDDLCNGSFKCNLTLDVPACEIPANTIPVCEDTLGLYCRTVTCEPETGDCVDMNLHEGEVCNDLVDCTSSDLCLSGECIGTTDDLACNDGEVCTDEYCDAVEGCVYVNNADACEDGSACTENDYCAGGVCNTGSDVVCDDFNVCTNEECDTTLGCVTTWAVDLDCDDLDACTTASTCSNGNCVATAEGCCTDDYDNDYDDFLDCDDPDCIGACPVVNFDCALVPPATFSGPAGATFGIRAFVTKSGVTDKTTGFDGHPYLRVQYAVGPVNSLADTLPSLTWQDATADATTDDASSDFWTGTVTVPEITDLSLERDYMVRVSGDQGDTWSYCDLDGTLNGYDYNMAGKIAIEAPYQLLFSEYMEGLSNNKAVEVFNASAFAAYLGDCTINVYSNGVTTPTNTFALSNVDLEPGDVFTVCHDSLALGSRVFCDLSNTKINHNGDDAVELICDGVVQDIFGVIGVRPVNNWGSGMTATKDHTLRRNCAVTQGTGPGVTEWDETQWIGFPVDTWQGFGTRLCTGDCVSNEAETCCLDAADNDLDGLIDCQDMTCKVTEACFIPVDWCQYAEPAMVRGSVGMTGIAFAHVAEAGITDVTAGNDAPGNLVIQFGSGPADTMPDDTWIWNNAEPAASNTSGRIDADTFKYNFTVPNVPEGFYDLAFRASADGGYSWKLCDLNGSDDGYTLDQAGVAEVVSAPNVFFTEYVDGTGSDKAVEIFNNSGRTLDLHNCMISSFTDGATGVSSSFWLEDGVLAENGVYVICQTGASPALTPYCDEFASLLAFNGNDTLILTCEDKPQDVIGQRGFDPGIAGWGWGYVSTVQHTLRRACDVAVGDQMDTDVFDPAVEWMGYAVDTFLGLGAVQCGDACSEGGIESCCGDDVDNDLDGLADCLDFDCEDATECQPLMIQFTMLEMPRTLSYEFGGDSPAVFARVFLTGVTSGIGQGAGIIGEAGWGPVDTMPDNPLWTWHSAIYSNDVDVSDDMYTAKFQGVPVGTFDYAFRFTADAGGHWLYGDGNGSMDGYNPANAGSMTVTAGIELICDDAIDNDGDLLADCDDSDCAGSQACLESANCYDGVDNDGDTFTDCLDWDCDTTCVEAGKCDDAFDNDQNGKTDCEDAACIGTLACAPDNETVCDDTVDEDFDGATDCDDVDCVDDPFCIPDNETICDDTIDEDRDGVTDCGDADCVGTMVCAPDNETVCNDTVDEDFDGATDCDDVDCVDDPFCIPDNETNCDNGVDEDRDGDFDCADVDCVDDPVCIPDNETNCTDTIDEDRDGVTDCADVDCNGNLGCGVETNCTDTLDDDGDGLVDCADYNCDGDVNCPVKVMFSEYGEGGSFNKWVEVWNYGTASRDLTGCSVTLYMNGSSTGATPMVLTVNALAAGDVWVMCHGSFDVNNIGLCDQVTGTNMQFNGDDAVVLKCGGIVMDSIGDAGFDPGTAWISPTDATISTLDKTLCRTVRTPDTIVDDDFNPGLQWISYPKDTFTGMGVAACQ